MYINGNKYKYLYLAALLLIALSYWIISWLQHPDDPLSSIIMYRVGDMEYFPFISALSHFRLGESMIYERIGRGILSIPFGALLPHALCYHFFSAFGFVIADMIIFVGYYIILVKVLKSLGISDFLAISTALLVVSGALEIILSRIFSFLTFNYISELYFWDLRIPRPFVTEIFLLLCFYFILKPLSDKKNIARNQPWVFLGICTAFLLQADIYAAAMIGICIFLFIMYIFLTYKDLRDSVIKGALINFIAMIIISIPFLLQRLIEHPDVPRRLGIFPIDRTKPVFLPGYGFKLFILASAGLIFLKLVKKYSDADEGKAKIIGIIFLCFACLAAYISLPLWCVLLGKGIQLYHFQETLSRTLSITLLVFCLYALEITIKIFHRKFNKFKPNLLLKNGFRIAVISSVLFFSLFYAIKRAYTLSENNKRMRCDLAGWGLQDNYRDNFVSLIKELSKKDYIDCKVMGTFDAQLCYFWLTFRNGYSYLGEPFITTVSDSEIESRLISLFKLIGVNSKDFLSLVNRGDIHVSWLAHVKYQTSRLYTFRPVSDYDEHVIKNYLQKSILSSWNIVIPNSEDMRLVDQFNGYDIGNPTMNNLRLDLIVLVNDEDFKRFDPPKNLFTLTYRNSMFRVWKRL